MSAETKKLKAVFRGQDGSCGYHQKVEYTLNMSHDKNSGVSPRYISIESPDVSGGGHCDYNSLGAFLNNWDYVRSI